MGLEARGTGLPPDKVRTRPGISGDAVGEMSTDVTDAIDRRRTNGYLVDAGVGEGVVIPCFVWIDASGTFLVGVAGEGISPSLAPEPNRELPLRLSPRDPPIDEAVDDILA
jgi:hypothetical protein